jgi:membrane protein
MAAPCIGILLAAPCVQPEEMLMRIRGLRGLGPAELLKKSVQDFFKDDMTTYAAALAYQVLFSIFPFIIFLIALLGFLRLSTFFDWLRSQMQLLLPEQAMHQVNLVISELQQPQTGLLSVGVVAALWTASAGIRATMHALNVAYNVKEQRPAWKLYPLSIFYTIGAAILMVVAAALLVVGPEAMQWLAHWVGLEQIVVFLWSILRLPVAMFLLTVVVALIYHVGPNVRQEFHLISPGAVISVLVWVGGSLAFDYYIRNYANYNAMYGSVGAVVVLLLYFYISAAVLLFGAELNAAITQYGPEGKPPQEKETATAS